MESTTEVFCKYKEAIHSVACVKEDIINTDIKECDLQINLINDECVQSSSNCCQTKDQLEITEQVTGAYGVEKLGIKEEPLEFEYACCDDEYLNNQSDQVQSTNTIWIKSEYNDYKTADMINSNAGRKYFDQLTHALEDRIFIPNDINDLNKVSAVSNHTTMTCKLEMSHETAINEEKYVNVKSFSEVAGSKSGKNIYMNKSDRKEICDKPFKSDEVSSTHKNINKCDICGKCFSRHSHFIRHMKIHNREKPFKCDICGKGFSENRIFMVHMRTHTGERPFKCDICGNRFIEKGRLNVHIKIHTEEKRHKCDICGKGFQQKGHLSVHNRTHTGEKRYKCDICGKCFSEKCNLNTHIKTHSGDRPFKCDICGKHFSENRNLNVHLSTHTGERPFKCGICDKSFSGNRKLYVHMRTHTGERPVKCDICGKRFRQQSHLNAHIKAHIVDKQV